jgi:hypothetical protein
MIEIFTLVLESFKIYAQERPMAMIAASLGGVALSIVLIFILIIWSRLWNRLRFWNAWEWVVIILFVGLSGILLPLGIGLQAIPDVIDRCLADIDKRMAEDDSLTSDLRTRLYNKIALFATEQLDTIPNPEYLLQGERWEFQYRNTDTVLLASEVFVEGVVDSLGSSCKALFVFGSLRLPYDQLAHSIRERTLARNENDFDMREAWPLIRNIMLADLKQESKNLTVISRILFTCLVVIFTFLPAFIIALGGYLDIKIYKLLGNTTR